MLFNLETLSYKRNSTFIGSFPIVSHSSFVISYIYSSYKIKIIIIIDFISRG